MKDFHFMIMAPTVAQNSMVHVFTILILINHLLIKVKVLPTFKYFPSLMLLPHPSLTIHNMKVCRLHFLLTGGHAGHMFKRGALKQILNEL